MTTLGTVTPVDEEELLAFPITESICVPFLVSKVTLAGLIGVAQFFRGFYFGYHLFVVSSILTIHRPHGIKIVAIVRFFSLVTFYRP
jgi:hypothetical protein